MLKEADSEDIDARKTQLKSNCNHLMGLEMSAEPKIAAFGYFNAAIRAKYLSLVVQERYHETKDELSFNIYSTTTAKENYNTETGMIGECEENGECNGMDAYWYFCKKQIRCKFSNRVMVIAMKATIIEKMKSYFNKIRSVFHDYLIMTI